MWEASHQMPKIKLGFKFNGLSLPFPKSSPVGSSPAVRAQKKAKRAEEAKKLRERSEQKRFKAILKKYGTERSAEFGVPQKMIDAAERAAAREARGKARKATKAKQNS